MECEDDVDREGLVRGRLARRCNTSTDYMQDSRQNIPRAIALHKIQLTDWDRDWLAAVLAAVGLVLRRLAPGPAAGARTASVASSRASADDGDASAAVASKSAAYDAHASTAVAPDDAHACAAVTSSCSSSDAHTSTSVTASGASSKAASDDAHASAAMASPNASYEAS